MKLTLLTIVLSLQVLKAWAQSTYNLSLSANLSNSSVLSVCKDDFGFMWFGTRYGLNRFDGNEVKHYLTDPNDPKSLSSSDYIFSVINDKQGGVWVGTKTGLNHYMVKTDNFIRYLNDRKTRSSLSDNLVNCLLLDHKNKLWVGTGNGLNMLEGNGTSFHRYLSATGNHLQSDIFSLFEDKINYLWAGSENGIFRFSNDRSKVEYYGQSKGVGKGVIRTITSDSSGKIWVGMEAGDIYYYDKDSDRFVKLYLHQADNLGENFTRKIFIDKHHCLWIGTVKGLKIYAMKDGQELQELVPNQLKQKSIKEIYQDDKGNIWLGTMYQGVYAINPNAITFESFHYSKDDLNTLSGDVISALCSTKMGIWIGTEGNGLNFLGRSSNKIKRIGNLRQETNLVGDFIKTIMEDKNGYIWLGSYLTGIKKYDPSKESFKTYRKKGGDSCLTSDYVSSLMEDRNGNIWAGTDKGLHLYDAKKDRFYRVDPQKKFGRSLTSEMITCLYEDSRRHLWIGTPGGLNVYDTKRQVLVEYYKKTSLSSLYIADIKEDMEGNLWIGTFADGLLEFKVDGGPMKQMTVKDGLPSNNIKAIEVGDYGSLWISTDHGLSNLKQNLFYNYGVRDGFPIGEFSTMSSTLSTDSVFYFGSYYGLVAFKDRHYRSKDLPRVMLTDLKVFDSSVHSFGKNSVLQENIVLGTNIVFQHTQNVFTISFSALNYTQPERSRYAYRLKGFNQHWIYTKNGSVTYMNLPAGHYKFYVKGTNSDGVWSAVTSIDVIILPPWWKTWWAYCLYGVLCFASIVYLFWSFKKRIELKNDIYLKNWKSMQVQKELDAKMNFFTHVSHEIRTPLTLLTTPLEKVIDETKDNIDVKPYLSLMKRNADRLMQLVDELLDFRKLGSDGIKLNLDSVELVAFCQGVCDGFQTWAHDKDIILQFDYLEVHSIFVQMDTNQMEKVLSNLLSNALKFTPNKGIVGVVVETNGNDEVLVHVWDNGIGISSAAGKFVFQEFFQGENSLSKKGWGIGLAMAKQLLTMHGGTIWLENEAKSVNIKASTCFTFSLPVSQVEQQASRQMEPFVQNKAYEDDLHSEYDVIPVEQKNEYSILVVEDNVEMMEFMTRSLEVTYNIISATNGLNAQNLLLINMPDLVLSDIAMPGLNGLDLCSMIKNDIRTSHIPVILLTARGGTENQIEGLSMGANAYVTKPFSLAVLMLTVRNTLEQVRLVREKYFKKMDDDNDPQSESVVNEDLLHNFSPLDLQFLDQISQIILDGMGDDGFNATILIKKMGMSRTVIFKKIKSLTGMNINEFSKSIRLKEAASLLKQQDWDMSVAELSYRTGFGDPKYFSKEFKKLFGLTPSEYFKSSHPS